MYFLRSYHSFESSYRVRHVPKYNLHGADFDSMRLLLSVVEWEIEMTDLS